MLEGLVDFSDGLYILSQDPQHATVYFAGLDFRKGLDKFIANGLPQLRELLNDLSVESHIRSISH